MFYSNSWAYVSQYGMRVSNMFTNGSLMRNLTPEAIPIETVISKHTVICCNRIEPKQSTWQIAKVPNSVKRRAVNSTNHANL